MKFCTIKDNEEQAAVCVDNGIITVAALNAAAGTDYSPDMLGIIQRGEAPKIAATLAEVGGRVPKLAADAVQFGPAYRNPPSLWGFGPTFRRHADDLGAKGLSKGPACNLKPATTIIGPGDEILLPPESQRVTAEAELAVVIGTDCKDISPEEAPAVIFGYAVALDMTAEDLLRENLRYISRSKGFDTFFSLGPYVVTPEELTDLPNVRVGTSLNGEMGAEAPLSWMLYDIMWLISHQSQMCRLLPGDILSTGTPGASVIRHGDRVEASVTGIGTLSNPVRDKVGRAGKTAEVS